MMLRGIVLALVLVVVGASVSDAAGIPASTVEFLAGGLGSAVGWAGGFFLGRSLASAWDLQAQPDQKDLVTVSTLAITVTLGTTLGVWMAASAYSIDGSEVLAAGGALLGMIAGMAVEPILAIGLSSILPEGAMSSPALGSAVEVVGAASMVLLPALLSTIGFNLSARDR